MSADGPALLRWGATRVSGISGETARLDAELLLAHALGVERLAMLARPGPVAAGAAAAFRALVERRRRGEPVAYLVGEREFWSLKLRVTPDVLIPRPDSETLIEAAIDHFAGGAPELVLDLGTGSGALLLAALSVWPQALGVGVDLSPAALAVAKANALSLGFSARAHFLASDWAAGVAGRFDLLLSNPPYVEAGAALAVEVRDHEPHLALFAGEDGLSAYRRLIPALPGLLRPGGVAIIEAGAGQAGRIEALAAGAGLDCRFRADLAGLARAACLTPVAEGLGKATAGR